MRLSAGSQKDVVQFSLKAQPICPVPEIGQVNLEMQILDDAEYVLKVMGAAAFSFIRIKSSALQIQSETPRRWRFCRRDRVDSS
jgi:hypothetical protein